MSEQKYSENTDLSRDGYDISAFDFTIADPGESPSPSVPSAPEEPRKPSAKRRMKEASASLSSKLERLMEDKPKKERPNKKEKPGKKEGEVVQSSSSEGEEFPENTPSPWRISKGSVSQICRRWVRYALRPSSLYNNINEGLWPLFLGGIGVFFAAFYLLIGLDWLFADLVSPGRLWAVVLVGALVGGSSASLFALGTQGVSLLCKKEKIRPFRMLSAFAGACVCPSVLLVLGFFIQVIFRVSVSMSFGIVAVLWMMYGLLEVLRDILGEKKLFFSALTVTLWGFVTFLLMTLTFTLK